MDKEFDVSFGVRISTNVVFQFGSATEQDARGIAIADVFDDLKAMLRERGYSAELVAAEGDTEVGVQ